MRRTGTGRGIRGAAARTYWNAAVAVVAVALTATGCATWPQLGGSASRTGYQPLESSISRSNVSSLAERWTGDIGGYHGMEGDAHGPVVANGAVYVGYAGSLLAFDAAGKRNCAAQCE